MENINDENVIENKNLNEIAQKKFLDYAMYVIVDRALPDIRDGLKPVHRRILWGQKQLNNYYNKPYLKSARVVGDVIGKYHPHGDSAVYDSLVRMAQPFSLRANLVDGQGNFGSIDGDSPAAMRYTESRQSKFADSMFTDIDKETVNMQDNYDGTQKMPEVLPVRYPNLLVNGTQGIAVGMASYIPTHNPIEVLECVNYLLDCKSKNEDPDLDVLMEIMPAPDFSTGGLVHGLSEMRDVWLSGRGKLKLRAKWHHEELDNGQNSIVITEIPYQVQKEKLVEKVVELANPNKEKGGLIEIEGVSDIRDESDKDVRIIIKLKRDFDPEIVFNQLVKKTQLEVGISYNATVLVDGAPKVVGLLEILKSFLEFREQVIINRTEFLKRKADQKMYLLEGLYKALDKLDEVIDLIRKSKNPSEAVQKLTVFLNIEEEQAKYVTEMKLSRLTSSQREEITLEMEELKAKLVEYGHILSSVERRIEIMREENEEQIDVFANTKAEKVPSGFSYGRRMTDISKELIKTDLASITKEEQCTILYSSQGYLRRMPSSELESQNRGTRGKRYMKLKEKDFIQQSIESHSHDTLLIISEKGKVFALHAYEIPDVEQGRYIKNIIELPEDEKVLMIIPVTFAEDKYLAMITKKGNIKRTKITEYSNSFRKSGLIGINLKENDLIVYAGICENEDHMAMVNSKNLIIRFNINDDSVRVLSRTSQGVRGMTLDENVDVIGGAVIPKDSESLLACITETGMVKLTYMSQYRVQNRGGKGVKSFKDNDRTGNLFKALVLDSKEKDLVTTTKKGISNRISVSNINTTNRTTSGVKLIKLDDKDSLADVFSSEKNENED